MLGEILLFCEEILGKIAQALGLLNIINAFVSGNQLSPTDRLLLQATSDTIKAIDNGTYGLAAMTDQLDAIQATLATLQQSGVPVTLPTTPPSGYGVDTSTLPGLIWAYPDPTSGQPAIDLLADAGLFVVNLANMEAQFPVNSSRFFSVTGTWWSDYGTNSSASDPIFPVANILPTDTLDVFLERESFWTGWTQNGSGFWIVNQAGGTAPFYYICTLSDLDFINLRDSLTPASSTFIPPVWPGIANVVLGSSVALSSALVVEGPMNGLLVHLSSTPPGKPTYLLGTELATAHIGQVAFQTDNDQMEYPQNLSFAEENYCPQTMVSAVNAMIRCVPGVSGYCTPWSFA